MHLDNMRRLLHILDFADSHPTPCAVFSLDAFGAAGAGGRGEADPRPGGEAGPAEGEESRAGNIPG